MTMLNRGFKHIMIIIAISMVVVLNACHLTQSIFAQNMTSNQTGNQTSRIDLLPPNVLEEEENLTEMFGSQY
jgi:hypothetical protein